MLGLEGGICHSPDKYLTPECNTHMEAVFDTAPTVHHWSPRRPLALMWDIIQKAAWIKDSEMYLTQEKQCICDWLSPFLLVSISKFSHNARLPEGFACKDTSCFLCWLWLVMFRTQKDISQAVDEAKEKGGGWLFCILGGLPPLVGKLNIYILQLELLFSHFIFHNIDYTLVVARNDAV